MPALSSEGANPDCFTCVSFDQRAEKLVPETSLQARPVKTFLLAGSGGAAVPSCEPDALTMAPGAQAAPQRLCCRLCPVLVTHLRRRLPRERWEGRWGIGTALRGGWELPGDSAAGCTQRAPGAVTASPLVRQPLGESGALTSLTLSRS